MRAMTLLAIAEECPNSRLCRVQRLRCLGQPLQIQQRAALCNSYKGCTEQGCLMTRETARRPSFARLSIQPFFQPADEVSGPYSTFPSCTEMADESVFTNDADCDGRRVLARRRGSRIGYRPTCGARYIPDRARRDGRPSGRCAGSRIGRTSGCAIAGESRGCAGDDRRGRILPLDESARRRVSACRRRQHDGRACLGARNCATGGTTRRTHGGRQASLPWPADGSVGVAVPDPSDNAWGWRGHRRCRACHIAQHTQVAGQSELGLPGRKGGRPL